MCKWIGFRRRRLQGGLRNSAAQRKQRWMIEGPFSEIPLYSLNL
jgi:hypothetical protein